MKKTKQDYKRKKSNIFQNQNLLCFEQTTDWEKIFTVFFSDIWLINANNPIKRRLKDLNRQLEKKYLNDQ